MKGNYGATSRDGEPITPDQCGAGAFVHWEAHKTQSTRGEGWSDGSYYAYGVGAGAHFTHVYDKNWLGTSGPAYCNKFAAESVQSVAVTHVPGDANAIVATASPHEMEFAKGMLGFFDATVSRAPRLCAHRTWKACS